MKRGEIWTVAGGSDYGGKPRPVVIVQEDGFIDTESVTVCLLTTSPADAPLFRLPVEPSEANGSRSARRMMIDKVTTVKRSKIGTRIGRLDDADVARLNQAILVFLGLAARGRS